VTKKVILSIVGILYLILSISSANNGGDFDVFLDAAQKLSNGNNIYVGPFIKGLQYFYSPLFALVLIPFSGNFFVTELIWLLLSWFWLYRIWVLVSSYFNSSFLSSKELNIWLGVSFFLVIRFILYNIAMIQVTIFLLWAILESIQLIENQKEISGAALLALVINIKLMPLVVLPYLLYRGYFKSLGFVLVFTGIYLILPAIFIGYDFNLFLLGEWWSIINPSNSEHVIEAEITYQSLVGTIPVFLTETESIIEIKRNFLKLPIETVTMITNVSRLIVAGFTIYFLGVPFRKNVDKLSKIWAVSYLLLAIPLIFPHQQKYAFLFMFPMITYLVYYVIIKWKYDNSNSLKLFVVPLILVTFVFTPIIGSDIIGRHAYDVIQHFRILGISALMLIPFMVIATPKSITKMISDNQKSI
jgi:hypothetical protein